ncbi:MAG TPA: hypothetical protein VJN90_11230 [Candidatus Acidoferrales bacterium]|nr:hypothetical protein [Candidatus Acidoferrales bacterium]
MKHIAMRAGLLGIFFCLALSSPARAGDVVVLTYAGPINAISAEYISRGITEAESRRASALILQLDTPGGLDSAMRKMVKAEMNARVPVIVFVAPRGARAASAGCFIVLAADVAAMAPGTNIGAAHPILIFRQYSFGENPERCGRVRALDRRRAASQCRLGGEIGARKRFVARNRSLAAGRDRSSRE